MERIIRNVREIEMADRQAIEHVIGNLLREDQQVIIDIVSAASPPRLSQQKSTNDTSDLGQVPAWWNVYEGLTEEEIDTLDAAVRQRANLTRVFE